MNAEQTKCEPDRSEAPKEERANVVNHSQLNSAKRGVGLAKKAIVARMCCSPRLYIQ